MHAYLITGGTNQQRLAYIENQKIAWQISTFDIVKLETEGASIGISDVRSFQAQLLLKPFTSPFTLGLIPNVHLLTIQAQNALLKTLEEPPPHTRLIIETAFSNLLLPTVLSRCLVIQLAFSMDYAAEDIQNCCLTLNQLTTKSIGQRLKIIDQLTQTKAETTSWVDLTITALHQLLLNAEAKQTSVQKLPLTQLTTVQLIRRLLRARELLKANVNPKLVLDNVFSGKVARQRFSDHVE